jgi:hypothetical protein
MLIDEVAEAYAAIASPKFRTWVTSRVMVELAAILRAGTTTLEFPTVPPDGTKFTVTEAALEE